MEDVDVIADLCSLNTGVTCKYDLFWEESHFLNEKTAVDDRKHGHITHLACALSVHDLVYQVKVRCSDDILIPFIEWVWLQFWPKTPAAKVALQYTGPLGVKFKVQQRQWRRDHIDSHQWPLL